MLWTIARAAMLSVMCILPTVAAAEKIPPQCAGARDKLMCACMLNNGGGVAAGHWYKFYSARGRNTNSGGQTNQDFTNCMIRNGRS
jgi:hypothetical protein